MASLLEDIESKANNPGLIKIMTEQKIDTANKQIQSYDSRGISIDGNYTQFPCLIFGTTIRTDILPLKFELFNNEHLNILEQLSPELILVGTGTHQQFPKPQQVNYERAIEFMDTGSACRVFNILLTEDRLVLAALFPA